MSTGVAHMCRDVVWLREGGPAAQPQNRLNGSAVRLAYG